MSAGQETPRYFRGRFPAGFFAHLWKAVTKQHHRELTPLLRGLIPEDGIVFDVGAHAGQYAKLFARLAPKGFVYAFEPQSYARRILRAAIRLNRLRNVAILPFGLGAASGIAMLTLPVKKSGSYGFGLAHMGHDDGKRDAEREAVAVATLDQAVAALGLARLDFIKADIEGFEQRMVAGGKKSLKRLQPALLLECNQAHLARAGDSVAGLWTLLEGLGYRAHDPGSSDLAPIAKPREGDILFLMKKKSR
jgi:FkbM family methyltransferase